MSDTTTESKFELNDSAKNFLAWTIGITVFIYVLVLVFHGLLTGSWVLVINSAFVIVVGTIVILFAQGNAYKIGFGIMTLAVLLSISMGAVNGFIAESQARGEEAISSRPPPVIMTEVVQSELTNLFVPDEEVTATLVAILLAIGVGSLLAYYLETLGWGIWVEVVILIVGGLFLAGLLWPHRSVYSPEVIALSNQVFWKGAWQATMWSTVVFLATQLSRLVKGIGGKGILGAITAAVSLSILYSTSVIGIEHAFYNMAVKAVIGGLSANDVFSFHMSGKFAGLFIVMIVTSFTSMVINHMMGETAQVPSLTD